MVSSCPADIVRLMSFPTLTVTVLTVGSLTVNRSILGSRRHVNSRSGYAAFGTGVNRLVGPGEGDPPPPIVFVVEAQPDRRARQVPEAVPVLSRGRPLGRGRPRRRRLALGDRRRELSRNLLVGLERVGTEERRCTLVVLRGVLLACRDVPRVLVGVGTQREVRDARGGHRVEDGRAQAATGHRGQLPRNPEHGDGADTEQLNGQHLRHDRRGCSIPGISTTGFGSCPFRSVLAAA